MTVYDYGGTKYLAEGAEPTQHILRTGVLTTQTDQALHPAGFGQLLGWQPALVPGRLRISSQERAVLYAHSRARASLAFLQTNLWLILCQRRLRAQPDTEQLPMANPGVGRLGHLEVVFFSLFVVVFNGDFSQSV